MSLVADHYQHIALIGVVALAGAAWSVWRDLSQSASRPATIAAATVLVGALTILTRQQSALYAERVFVI